MLVMGELHPERGCEHLDPQEGAPRPVTALGSTGYRTLDPSARISGLERSDLVLGSRARMCVRVLARQMIPPKLTNLLRRENGITSSAEEGTAPDRAKMEPNNGPV